MASYCEHALMKDFEECGFEESDFVDMIKKLSEGC